MKTLAPCLASLVWAGFGFATDAQSLFNNSALLGDCGGLRREGDGVSVRLAYTQEYIGVVCGGLQRTAEYNALASLDLEFDLEKLVHWKGAVFHTNGYAIIGSSISVISISSSSNVSNINGRNSIRLFEAYLDQTLFDGHLSIRLGQQAVDSEFFGSSIGVVPGGCAFLNSDFGALPIVSLNAPVSIYAIAAPGLRLRVSPTDSSYIQIGVYDGNPAPDFLGDPTPGFTAGRQYNDHGIDFHLDASEGAFLIGEAGFTIHQGKADVSHSLPGSYKLGGWYHTDHFTRWSDGASVAGNWAVYAIAAQEVWQENTPDHQGLYFFARVSASPPERAQLDWAVDGGVNYVGLFPGREGDIFGVGYSYKNYSSDLSDALKRTGQPGVAAESVLEVTYQINLAPWLTIQPDFQYVFQPGGRANSPNAAVVGIRLGTLF